MNEDGDPLAMDDAALLNQCDVDVYKASGPGGQHRNKVSSAVRVRHRPTGVMAHGDDSRSQHENKRLALRRLRITIACRIRRPVGQDAPAPPAVGECLFTARGGPNKGKRRLEVGRRDARYWQVAAHLLDLLEFRQGRLSEAAASLGIATANFADVLRQDRHVLAAAQDIRKRHGHGPIR